MVISFLLTRVRDTYFNNYKKLARVVKYIQDNIGLPLIPSIDKSGNIKWYVDSEFSAYKNMRSHTYGVMTMGTGQAYVQSIKK